MEDSDDDFYLIFAADLELNAFGAIILMVDFSTPKVLWQMQNSWERRKQFSEGGQNNFGRKLSRHISFLKFVTTALLDKCNQDRLKIATAIGESLEQALRFKCCPAPRKFSHQNFVDYVNSVNVACKGHISGICAHQNHQNNQSSAEWEPLN